MMQALKGFRFMLASRGWRRGLRRAWLIWRRFGFTHRRMVRHLRSLLEVLERHDAKATLFVPATVLADHRRALEAFRVPSLEWGVHSDYHTDLSRMDGLEQAGHIANAVALFDAAEWPFVGFRAPYLKTHPQTAAVLTASGRFVYDSSPCVLRDDIYGADEPSYGFTMGFYRPRLGSEGPTEVTAEGEAEGKTLVRIPVSLPDDDILIDRDRRSPQQVLAVWSAMLRRSHQLGEIFVLQLHPERASELAGVLTELLAQARQQTPPVWIATLAEVAERAKGGADGRPDPGWPAPYQSAFCVTGDLDAMAIRDFVKRLRTW